MIKLRFNNLKMSGKSSWLIHLVAVLCLSSSVTNLYVLADFDGLETTTTEFDPSTRGALKFGDKCEMTQQCGFAGSICYQSYCTCSPEFMSTNHVDKCGKAVSVNETCFFHEQCEDAIPETECRDGRCICRFDKSPITKKDGSIECVAIKEKDTSPPSQVNPAMFLILIVMALMFIIICVVLRLFSKARWRENRTIFNTPNPRLMNVSLLRDNKLLHGGERRGSRISVRMPSRQPSMSSLRPTSPNASIGSRRGSRISNASMSLNHKLPEPHTVVSDPNDLLNVNQQQHLQHQLMMHQQQLNPHTQRRRSSVAQHQIRSSSISAASGKHATPHSPQISHQPKVQEEVKVEITEEEP